VILKRTGVIFSLLLVSSLVLAACNGIFSDDDDDNGVPPQPQETPVDDEEDEVAPTPEGEETPVVEETPEVTPDATPADDEVAEVDGEAIFMRECAACHGEEGQGFERDGSAIPPHNQNSLVVADEPFPVISVVLTGRGGMPRFDGVLTDEEIAAVVSYIRGAWDNDADPVDEQNVQDVRQEVIGTDDDVDDDDDQDDDVDEGDETQGAGDQDEDEDAEDADDE
jgi:cytochrome c6